MGSPIPRAHPPVPSPSMQVLERPLEEGGCDPEEPEQRWVQGRPVPSQLLVEGSREPPTHTLAVAPALGTLAGAILP